MPSELSIFIETLAVIRENLSLRAGVREIVTILKLPDHLRKIRLVRIVACVK